MRILFSRNFRKRFDRLDLYLQNKFKNRLKLLINKKDNNKGNDILNIHSLKGKYLGLLSMNVTGDIRAVFEYKNSTVLLFHDIGSHSELYS